MSVFGGTLREAAPPQKDEKKTYFWHPSWWTRNKPPRAETLRQVDEVLENNGFNDFVTGHDLAKEKDDASIRAIFYREATRSDTEQKERLRRLQICIHALHPSGLLVIHNMREQSLRDAFTALEQTELAFRKVVFWKGLHLGLGGVDSISAGLRHGASEISFDDVRAFPDVFERLVKAVIAVPGLKILRMSVYHIAALRNALRDASPNDALAVECETKMSPYDVDVDAFASIALSAVRVVAISQYLPSTLLVDVAARIPKDATFALERAGASMAASFSGSNFELRSFDNAYTMSDELADALSRNVHVTGVRLDTASLLRFLIRSTFRHIRSIEVTPGNPDPATLDRLYDAVRLHKISTLRFDGFSDQFDERDTDKLFSLAVSSLLCVKLPPCTIDAPRLRALLESKTLETLEFGKQNWEETEVREALIDGLRKNETIKQVELDGDAPVDVQEAVARRNARA